jgi:hypothetical protein
MVKDYKLFFFVLKALNTSKAHFRVNICYKLGQIEYDEM